MKYIIDTCVISEILKPKPNKKVVEYLNSIDDSKLYMSAMTIGELHKGIQKLRESKRKWELFSWLDAIEEEYENRILPFNKEGGIYWGRMMSGLDSKGKTMSAFDSIIAATGLEHHLYLITRNVKDFKECGVDIINPWG